MKVHEAIIASAPETLNDRQGFGLVRCYRNLPPSVRKRIRDWSYPSEMNGREIFTFCHQEAEGETWFLLNRTGKATDFTGRSSYISHTICFRERELKKWLQDCLPAILGPAEIMIEFPWKTAWSKSSPEWIEEDQLKILEDYGIQFPTNDPPPKSGDSNLLSAFSIDSNGRLAGNRCYWLTDKTDEREQLNDFRRAWHSADPWKAFPDLQNKLVDDYGPSYEAGTPWTVQFTTHLRSERSDSYDWVAVPLGSKVPSGRIALRQDREGWKSDVSDIGESLTKVVDRCIDPVAWADELIQKCLHQISDDRNHKESAIRAKFKDLVHTCKQKITEQYDKIRRGSEEQLLVVPATGEDLLKLWDDHHDWLHSSRSDLNRQHAETENHLLKLNESNEAVRSLAQTTSRLGLDLAAPALEERGVAHKIAWDQDFDQKADEFMREVFCSHVMGARADEQARLRGLEEEVARLNASLEKEVQERREFEQGKAEEAQGGRELQDTQARVQETEKAKQAAENTRNNIASDKSELELRNTNEKFREIEKARPQLQQKNQKRSQQTTNRKWIIVSLAVLALVTGGGWTLMTIRLKDSDKQHLKKLEQKKQEVSNLQGQVSNLQGQVSNLQGQLREYEAKKAADAKKDEKPKTAAPDPAAPAEIAPEMIGYEAMSPDPNPAPAPKPETSNVLDQAEAPSLESDEPNVDTPTE